MTDRDRTAEDREHVKLFISWLRKRAVSAADEAKLRELESKDILVSSSSDGGVAVPKVIAARIEEFEIKYSPVRRLIPPTQVSTSDFHELLDLRGANSGWVSETGPRNTTNTPQLRDIVPTFGELYARPICSQWTLDDLAFDVEKWLVQNVAREFAYQEGEAVIRGNGVNRPTGMLNTTPVLTADFASPLRAATAYQYLTGTGSPGQAVPSDRIIEAQYLLNAEYRPGAAYVMNSDTAAGLRKIKATNDEYIWQQQAATLAGYPLVIWEGMDDATSGLFPIAFGDFERGYLLCDRTELRISRDELTSPGLAKFYVRRRVGGIPRNNDAIKFIRVQ